MSEERFSDLGVIAMYYSERFEVEVDEVKAHPRKLLQEGLNGGVYLSVVG